MLGTHNTHMYELMNTHAHTCTHIRTQMADVLHGTYCGGIVFV